MTGRGGDDFYITLPSNASHALFPSNTNARYRTRLSRNLRLDVDADWTVGLSSVQFTKSWHNLTDGEIRWYELIGDISDVATDDTDLRATLSTDFPGPLSEDMHLYARRYAVVPSWHYETLVDVIDAVHGALYRTSLDNRLNFRVLHYKNRVEVRLKSQGGEIRRLTFSDSLCDVFGLERGTVVEQPGAEATRPPDLSGGVTALRIHSNVVADRMDGDRLAPLLRYVPLSAVADRSPFANVHIEFNNIQYHDVASFLGREVEVRVLDDEGRDVVFRTGKTVLTLHFKKSG